MEAQEIDVQLDELETRLDRLRSLYEQYFLGIEKIEPSVARKDVDRRFWLLRRVQIRNTARRFRLQVLIQRYNTFQQYWTRICREIENGTYVRHLLKAKKRLGEEPTTWAAKKRLGLLRHGTSDDADAPPEDASTAPNEPDLSGLLTGGDLDAEVLAATAAAFEHAGRPATSRSSAGHRFTLEDLGPLDLEFDEDDQPTRAAPERRASLQPAKPSAPARPPVPTPSLAMTRPMAEPGKVPTFPPPRPIGPAQPEARPRPPLPAPRATATASPQLPARPPLPARPAPPAARPPATAATASPAGARPSSAPPPRPRLPTLSDTAAKGPAPAPVASGSLPRPPLPAPPGGATRVPLPARPAAPAAPPALAGAEQARPPAARPAAQAPAATTAGTPPGPPARPRAAAPAPAPRELSDDRVRQLHQELSEAKKRLNQENHLSLDALAKSLRETEKRLRAEHQGRSVDFQVILKDGKPAVKPIVKK